METEESLWSSVCLQRAGKLGSFSNLRYRQLQAAVSFIHQFSLKSHRIQGTRIKWKQLVVSALATELNHLGLLKKSPHLGPNPSQLPQILWGCGAGTGVSPPSSRSDSNINTQPFADHWPRWL